MTSHVRPGSAPSVRIVWQSKAHGLAEVGRQCYARAMVRKRMNELSKRSPTHGMPLFAVAVGIVALAASACSTQVGDSADAGLEANAKDGTTTVDADARAATDARAPPRTGALHATAKALERSRFRTRRLA